MARTAAMLVIGNEILSGKVQDANTQALALTLRGLGIELRRVVTVPDEVALIAAELNALRAQFDYVFTSGGVGPTHDDVTIAAAARALGRQVVRNPALEALLRGLLRRAAHRRALADGRRGGGHRAVRRRRAHVAGDGAGQRVHSAWVCPIFFAAS
jgi:molybdenum cofactor synthesis domain-containing protein